MTSSLLTASISLSERLHANPPTSTRGNVNIVGSGDNSAAVCFLPYLIDFSYDGNPVNDVGQHQGLASVLLAMEHLNTGNGTFVSNIDKINQRCKLRFMTKSFNTESQQSVGVDHIISMTDRRNTNQFIPCAILGAGWSSISIPTSVISGLRGFPQISPISTSAALDGESHKLFGRTIPNDDGTAIPLLSKLHNDWGVNHLAVLHVDDAYGNAFAKGILLAAQKYHENIRVETVDLVDGASDAKVAAAVQMLKETEFMYFFGIIHSSMLDKVMAEAFNRGIAGTGKHTWIFSDAVASTPLGRSFEVGSSLEAAYRGAGFVSAVGGVPGMDSFDRLAKSLQQLGENQEDFAHFESRLPQDYSSEEGLNHTIITGDGSFLQSPGLIAPFLYDAVVALGLASCRLAESSKNDSYFSGEELFQAYLNTTFSGISGSIVFAETGTRDPRSALFSLTNFIIDKDKSTGGDVQFKGAPSDLYMSGKWENMVPFEFNDGSNEVPADLPFLETNFNYLGIGMKTTGYILCAAIILLSFGFGLWTHFYSKRSVVRSSQPVFLYIISGGALLMGSSIIPSTIAVSAVDQSIADSACVAFPWPLFTGFSLTFSALFTKTHRVNKIMKHATMCQRVRITAVDVMKPMAALLVLNIIILTVWTVIDPLRLDNNILRKDKFGRKVETYGKCTSDQITIFVAILCVINLGSLVFALFEAFKARHIATDLQESQYIFMAMTLILLVSFIGIPVIVIAKENVSAYYFLTVGIISVVCGSILLLIFVPKVQALRKKCAAETRNTSRPAWTRRETVESNGDDHTGGSNNVNRPSLRDRHSIVEGGGQPGVQILSVARGMADPGGTEVNEEVKGLTEENRELKEEIQALTGKNIELEKEIQGYQELNDEVKELAGQNEEVENQWLKDNVQKKSLDSHDAEIEDWKQRYCYMQEEYDDLEGKLEERERILEEKETEIKEKDAAMKAWKALKGEDHEL